MSDGRLLALALADDDLVLGYRESEWTGVAPLIEEDVALSSIAQDEIGHARALYLLVASLETGGDATAEDADRIAYDRPADGFLHACLCERPRGDWGEEIARRALYELADALRVADLERSSWTALAQLAAKIAREETYHLEHARSWLDRLAGDEEGRARLQTGLDAIWADALGLWEPVEGEHVLVRAGILPRPFAALRKEWLHAVTGELGRRGLRTPEGDPALGGRRGRHTAAFAAQLDEMTSVRRLVPGGSW